MTPAAARVFLIGSRRSDTGLTPDVAGGKAANLVRLDRLGLTVPPALVLTTPLCREYMARGTLPAGFRARLAASVRHLEEATGCTLGGRRPLLVSVRSSSPTSMPGMLKTVLNVGLTEETVRGLIRRSGNPWLAWDVYRRFARSFADACGAGGAAPFERLAGEHLARASVDTIQDLDPLALRDLARDTAALVPDVAGIAIPVDPLDQIVAAIEAVFRSWASPAAREYRRLNGLDDAIGTGVLIQAMVFGNSGARSGSGVGFTRNPATGVREPYIDFVWNAQGEDVVSGRLPVTNGTLLPSALPGVWTQLAAASGALEREFGDMQDFEFTVDDGQLFFLQSRSGQRTPWAALRIAVDLVREHVVEPSVALQRLAAYNLDTIVRVAVRPRREDRPIARATTASVGVATGGIVFNARRAQQLAAERPVILVRGELTTDDIAGLAAAAGVLTTVGGRTSHAAVVARQLGKVCLVGCAGLRIDDAAACWIGSIRLREGDEITLDGEGGLVYAGAVPVVAERPEADLALVATWRDRQLSGARV